MPRIQRTLAGNHNVSCENYFVEFASVDPRNCFSDACLPLSDLSPGDIGTDSSRCRRYGCGSDVYVAGFALRGHDGQPGLAISQADHHTGNHENAVPRTRVERKRGEHDRAGTRSHYRVIDGGFGAKSGPPAARATESLCTINLEPRCLTPAHEPFTFADPRHCVVARKQGKKVVNLGDRNRADAKFPRESLIVFRA